MSWTGRSAPQYHLCVHTVVVYDCQGCNSKGGVLSQHPDQRCGPLGWLRPGLQLLGRRGAVLHCLPAPLLPPLLLSDPASLARPHPGRRAMCGPQWQLPVMQPLHQRILLPLLHPHQLPPRRLVPLAANSSHATSLSKLQLWPTSAATAQGARVPPQCPL